MDDQLQPAPAGGCAGGVAVVFSTTVHEGERGIMRASVIIFFCLFISSCASNGYETYYNALNIPPSSKPQPILFSQEPKIIPASGDIVPYIVALYESGYGVIGQAGFVGPKAANEQAIAQAKKVGAAIVIVNQKYKDTHSGVQKITLPTVDTTVSSGTFNTYGAQPIYGTYSGTSTTYGTETRSVPYSVDRYNQEAVFLAPLTRSGTGMWLETMSTTDLQGTDVREGVGIKAVRRGSPADRAGFRTNDIIISANGRPTPTRTALMSIFRDSLGTPITLTVAHRGEESSDKEFLIPEGDW